MNLDELFAELEVARAMWTTLYSTLSGGSYDVTSMRKEIGDQSIAHLDVRANVTYEGLIALRPTVDDLTGIAFLTKRADSIASANRVVKDSSSQANNLLRANWRDGVTLRDQNDSFLIHLTLSDGSAVASVDLSANFQQIDSAISGLETHLSALLPLCRANSIGDLSGRALALAESVREVDALKLKARRYSEDAGKSAASSAERERAIQAALSQAEASLPKIAAIQSQATIDAATVTALTEKIKAISASADSLEQQVSGYIATFDAFQKQLDARNQDFVQLINSATAAELLNENRGKEIDRLTKLADGMISGATTAGLGKSMEDTRVRYEKRMKESRLGFYVAVGLLVASALPLAAHLMPGLLGSWIAGIDPKGEGSPYAVLGKIVLLLPATWLTAFFTKSYADSFHLEREYAHKAALAMSVDGFKRQAEKYQEEITAEVFLEIRNNPAKGNPITPSAHPLYDVLAKVVGKVLAKGEEAKS
jgi:hypothetical protein